MSVESDLLEALAFYLDAQGVAQYKGIYTATDTAIVFGPLQPSPDRQVALTVYGSSDDPKQTVSTFRVQIYCRGQQDNSLDVGDLASTIFDQLQGIQDLPWGATLFLVQCYRVSFIPQGMDANNRAERADNYVFQVSTPATIGRS